MYHFLVLLQHGRIGKRLWTELTGIPYSIMNGIHVRFQGVFVGGGVLALFTLEQLYSVMKPYVGQKADLLIINRWALITKVLSISVLFLNRFKYSPNLTEILLKTFYEILQKSLAQY